MKDALGAVQSVLVLGGNSEIAQATVQQLVGQRARTVVLAGRKPEAMDAYAASLKSAGAHTVDTVAFDALDFASHTAFVDEQFAKYGSFDLVLLAFGVLGDQEQDAANPQGAVDVVQANFTGAVSVLLPVSQKLQAQGHGTIVVLSTVAGERARKDNFIYGSSKAGLDAFCQGLGDSLVGTGVSLLIVRPGFVTTKMTAHMDKKPMSTDAKGVADVTIKALGRGDEIAWAPGILRYVFIVMKLLPRPIFRKLKA